MGERKKEKWEKEKVEERREDSGRQESRVKEGRRGEGERSQRKKRNTLILTRHHSHHITINPFTKTAHGILISL